MSDQQPDETPVPVEATPEPTPESAPESTPEPGTETASEPAPSPAQPPATWPAADAAAVPHATPPVYTPPVAVPTSSNAIIAFVLSIVSWAICPIVPAIVALVLASSAQREIAAGQGRVQGGGLVTAAKIVSWINIGLWAAVIVIGVFVALLAAVASS